MGDKNLNDRFPKEVQDRSDFDGALENLRRFREMVGERADSQQFLETTRGTWAQPDLEAVGWRVRG